MPRALATLGLLLTLAAAAASPARGGIFSHRHEGHGHEEKPHPTPEPGRPRHFCHTFARAGYPNTLAKHLEPTNAGDSYGYYVGGGGGHGAGSRCREEGTFGWDYTGVHFPRRVILGWNHGRKDQGGTGSYGTNPPFEVPNVFEVELPRIHHEREAGGEGH